MKLNPEGATHDQLEQATPSGGVGTECNVGLHGTPYHPPSGRGRTGLRLDAGPR